MAPSPADERTESLRVYEARPKGRFTARHRRALRDSGFVQMRDATFLRLGRGPRPVPWGCTVRLYQPPKVRGRFAVALGILDGTLDELGRPR